MKQFTVDVQQLLSDRKYDYFITVTRTRDGKSKSVSMAGGPGNCASYIERLKKDLADPLPDPHWCHWQSDSGRWHKLEFDYATEAHEFCNTLNGAADQYVSANPTRTKDTR